MSYMNSIPRAWRERVTKYRLIGGRCKSCGKVFYPYRSFCPRCGSSDIEKIELPKRGKIKYFTVVRSAPAEFKKYEPYIVALVELENGAIVPAQITDAEPEELREGMPVEGVLRRYREQGEDGIIEYGIKFRPVVGEE